MLVTDGGQLIRVPGRCRPQQDPDRKGRSTQGRDGVQHGCQGEKVVSVECISDDGEGDGEAEAGPAPEESSGE
jgi:DNA gyrase subunit A